MIRKINIFLLVFSIAVLIGGLLSANAWSTYNYNLEIKLQFTQEQVSNLQAKVKLLETDNKLKDEQIIKLESQPK